MDALRPFRGCGDLGGVDTARSGLRPRLRASWFFREAIAERVDRRSSSNRLYQLSREPRGDVEEDPTIQSLVLVIADMTIQIMVLREYCRHRFDDAHDRDWFDAYRSLSVLFHEQMGAVKNAGSEAVFHFDGLDWPFSRDAFQKCRRRCLTAERDKRFSPLRFPYETL